MTVRELEAHLNGLGALPPGMQIPDRSHVSGALPAAAPKIDLIRSQILDHAKRDPETVAKLVRTWLNEERKKEE